MPDKKIRVLLMIQEEITALQYHRQLMPHNRLVATHGDQIEISQKKGFTVDGKKYEATIDDLSDEQLKQFDIVCFLRQISFDKEQTIKTAERLRGLGVKIVLDIDDYWQLDKTHPLYKIYNEKGTPENTAYSLELSDWITTTTDYFSGNILPYNGCVSVIPNCISPDAKQFEYRYIPSTRMRFGWIGGVYHREDLAMITPAFSTLRKRSELYGKYQLCLGGFNTNKEYIDIEAMFTDNYYFRTADPGYYSYLNEFTPLMDHYSFDKEYRRLWGLDIWNYGQLYNQIDVALVPLRPTEFNKCKSELKIVEAGWMGKAMICTDTLPYNKIIINGKNGILVPANDNGMGWFTAMRKMILNPNMVEDMAGELNRTIKEVFDMDKWNEERMKIYKTLIA